jgi:hypothetical protein
LGSVQLARLLGEPQEAAITLRLQWLRGK